MLDASGAVSDVIAIGKEALSDASGTVSDVIAIGKQALKNNQQTNNIAIVAKLQLQTQPVIKILQSVTKHYKILL